MKKIIVNRFVLDPVPSYIEEDGSKSFNTDFESFEEIKKVFGKSKCFASGKFLFVILNDEVLIYKNGR